MKKTTIFNKFKKTLLPLVITGITVPVAMAQCPQNITVTNTAGHCGGVVTYTAPAGAPGISANGVVNGNGANGFDSWNKTDGGDGWQAIGTGFITSYETCSKWQLVSLSAMGISDTYMDTSPAITVSEDYQSTGFKDDYYFLTVELRGAAGNVIDSYTTGTITTSFTPQTATHTFTGYPAGVRSVYIYDGGKDGEYWGGFYGSMMSNTQLKVVIPGNNVAQTGGLASGAEFPIGTTTNTFQINNAGTITTCSFDVTVTDTALPTVITKPATIALTGYGTATLTADAINNGSTDNCGIDTYAIDVSSFTCDNLGANTVTLTVTDIHGNKATGTAIVTVTDAALPVAVARPVTVQLDEKGEASVTAEAVNNASTDNCTIASYALDVTHFTCDNIGANTVTLTVTDAGGNQDTATAVVTVTDATAPEARATDFFITLGESLTASVTAAMLDDASTDNCSIASYSLDKTTFTCDDLGENTVTLTVTDKFGNTATATAVVTVSDSKGYCERSAGLTTIAGNDVTLYPNPTTGPITIVTDKAIAGAQVYDISGRLVNKLYLNGTGTQTADISALNTGVYFIKIFSNESSVIKRVVKE